MYQKQSHESIRGDLKAGWGRSSPLATGLVVLRLGARWSTLEGTITKPKVISEEVGRSAGAGMRSG